MFVFDFPSEWYILLGFSVALFAVFSLARRNFSGCIRFGIIGLVISAVTEFIGVSAGLWNYTNGNWPVILWPTYFVYTMSFYQIFKLLEPRNKINKKR